MANIKATTRNDITAIRRNLQRNTDLAVLGQTSDASSPVFVNDRPGYWWVRFIQAGGTYGPAVQVRGCTIPMSTTPGVPVKMGIVEGEKAVIGPDFVGLLSQGVNPTQAAVVDPNANNPSFVNQAFIATAFEQILEGTLKVGLRGAVPLAAGVFVKVEGQFDFTGSVPSAGSHCLAITAIQSDLSTMEIQYSTAKSIAIPLDLDDLNEAWALMSDPTTNKPLWSWDIGDGQTALIEANRWMDNRQFLNWESSGGGAGINQLTGDATAGPGTGSQALTLATVNGNVGTFSRVKSITANAKGLITAITQGLVDLASEVTGLLPLANGGTGADLSATGPGVLQQASSAAAVSVGQAKRDYLTSGEWFVDATSGQLALNVNIASPGFTALDGVTLTSGVSIILLVGQSTGHESGLWIFNGSSSPLTRPAWFASGSTTQCFYGLLVRVRTGTVNAGTKWYMSTSGAFTIDTTISNWGLLATNVLDAYAILGTAHGGLGSDFSATGGATQFLAQSATSVISARNIAVTDLPLTTKGQLLTYGSSPTLLGVGADGQFPMADSTQADGMQWHGPILDDLFLFGDGSDGNVTISGSVTLTRDMYYNNLTISTGAVLNTAGYRVFVAGILDITAAPAGSIVNNGAAASGITVGGAGAIGTLGSGQAGASGSAASNGTGTIGNVGDTGGTSGKGGNGANAGATGGGAATATGNTIRRLALDLIWGITLLTGGSGGAGGGNSGTAARQGGAGGAGGGIVEIAARTINRSGSTASIVQAKGGTGGTALTSASGTGAGGGGGAGGGLIRIIYKFLTGSSITNALDVSGGTGGAGNTSATTAGDGGDGGSGGRVELFNALSSTLTVSAGSAGSAGNAHSGNTPGTGGAGNTFRVSL